MTTFGELQTALVERTFQAFGLSPDVGQTFQPASPTGSDQSLWAGFNTVPEAGPIFMPSGSDFFTAYAAVIGALVPGRSPLDPIAVAKRRLADWGTKPPAWSIDQAAMLRLLAAAPATSFPFANPAAPTTEFWGLWASSPPVDGITSLFAAAKLDMTLSFGHLLNFAPTPAGWYVSSALANAYSNPGRAPWNPTSTITWDTAFGPGGTLERMTAGLVIADALTISYTSQAQFNPERQLAIRASALAGLWPYYIDHTTATTGISFDGSGRMTAKISTPAGQPFVLAGTVLSAGAYLGVG